MSDNKKSSIKKGSSCYLLNVKQPDRTAKRIKLGFRSVAGNLFLTKTNRMLDVSVGLLDMSEDGCGVYTSELLRKGTPLELTLTEPYPLRVSGVVIWSIPVSTKVHNAHYRCRSGIKFLFADEHSRSMVKDFLEKIATDPVEAIRNALNAPPVVMPPMPGSPAAQAAAGAASPNPAEGQAPVPPAAGAPAGEAAATPAPAEGAPVAAPEAAATPAAPVAPEATPAPAEAPQNLVTPPAATPEAAAPAPAADAPQAAEAAPATPPPSGENSGGSGSQAA